MSDHTETWDDILTEAEKDKFVVHEHELIFYSIERMGDHTAR